MIVRTLRLKKGWSQDHLAQLSGLSIRTIQRIERGQTPSLDSLQALAAVFEIEISDLQPQEETSMTPSSTTQEEQAALNYVRDIKGFYSHAIKYAVIISLLFVINLTTNPDTIWAIWPMIGWGVGLVFHGLNVFEVINMFGPDWEKKRVEKKLGRKI